MSLMSLMSFVSFVSLVGSAVLRVACLGVGRRGEDLGSSIAMSFGAWCIGSYSQLPRRQRGVTIPDIAPFAIRQAA